MTMKKEQVILKYKNWVMRPLTANDLECRVKWYNDPEVQKTLILDKPLELQKTIEWFESIKDSQTRLDMVISTSEGIPIGAAGLREIDLENQSAGIYMILGEKEYWGKSIMYEIHLCLLNHAFQSVKLEKVWANVLSNNVASYVTLKKVGFVREAVLENKFIRDSRHYDVYRMAIMSRDFYAKHPDLQQ